MFHYFEQLLKTRTVRINVYEQQTLMNSDWMHSDINCMRTNSSYMYIVVYNHTILIKSVLDAASMRWIYDRCSLLVGFRCELHIIKVENTIYIIDYCNKEAPFSDDSSFYRCMACLNVQVVDLKSSAANNYCSVSVNLRELTQRLKADHNSCGINQTI